nr:MAG TPA: peptidase [Microviridae sp.]
MIKCYIMDKEANEKIGQHFKVREFACKDGSQVVYVDDYLVSILDILRNKIGKPVHINSGYRTPEWNAKCGGAKYSYHMCGMAADIRVNGMSAKELANKLNEIVPDKCGIIVYSTWVHFDVRTEKKYRKGV